MEDLGNTVKLNPAEVDVIDKSFEGNPLTEQVTRELNDANQVVSAEVTRRDMIFIMTGVCKAAGINGHQTTPTLNPEQVKVAAGMSSEWRNMIRSQTLGHMAAARARRGRSDHPNVS